MVTKGRYFNPLTALTQNSNRRSSRAYDFEQGDFALIEAWYDSNSGGDNFALGAIFHNTSFNRKDRVTAIDEITSNRMRML